MFNYEYIRKNFFYKMHEKLLYSLNSIDVVVGGQKGEIKIWIISASLCRMQLIIKTRKGLGLAVLFLPSCTKTTQTIEIQKRAIVLTHICARRRFLPPPLSPEGEKIQKDVS